MDGNDKMTGIRHTLIIQTSITFQIIVGFLLFTVDMTDA